ncbi:MAG: biotin-dependent carboxyltransferase family protein [Candidatus Methylomirabilia bacterium]
MSAFAVLEPGPLTTVQDLGRVGYLRYGIPPSGPIDQSAFILANRLVGNPDTAAGLECTVSGPRLEARGACLIAVTGAEMPVTINGREAPRWAANRLHAGDVVRLGPARGGVRAYLAVSGGVDLPPVLGSRSTYVRGQLGGLEGRPLRKGDLLPLGPPALPPEAAGERRVRPDLVPTYGEQPEIRFILGPQADRFTEEGIRAFLTSSYEMLPQMDRMGARLKGQPITHLRGHDIVSDGIPLGGIQVVGGGQPIILLVDRQSTGGYTKVATVCSVDIGAVGQVKPGQRLRFRSVSVAEAHLAVAAERDRLAKGVISQ